MTWLWFLPILAFATVGFVFYPLFIRRGNAPLPVGLEGDPRSAWENRRDLLLRQLKELDEDKNSGEGKSEEALRQSLSGELTGELATVLTRLDEMTTTPKKTAPLLASSFGHRMAGLVVLLLVIGASGGLYLKLGTIHQPSIAQQAEDDSPESHELMLLVERMAKRLEKEPDNLKGWLQLGRSYSALKHPREAIAAYQHVLQKAPDNIDAAAGVAELWIIGGDPKQYGQGVAEFRRVLTLDPNHMSALWFLGVAAYRDGDAVTALKHWEHLLTLIPEEDEDRQTVEEMVQEAKGRIPGGTSGAR